MMMLCMLCHLCPGFVENIVLGFTDLVGDASSNDEFWQILLFHLEACGEILPACLEVAKGEITSHAALAQKVAEMLL